MAKKDKGPGINIKNVHAFDRLNFLHQAAQLMATIQYETKEKDQPPSTHVKEWQGDPAGSLLGPARYFNNNMKQITARLVMRVDPNVKRTICKRCETPQLAAITSTTRMISKPVPTVINQCKICKKKKRFSSQNPNYALFSSRPEQIIIKGNQ